MCCSAFALVVLSSIVATLSSTGGPAAAPAPALHAADDEAAQATEAPTKALAAPQCADGACDGCAIDASTKASIAAMIAGGGTVLLGIPHVRCIPETICLTKGHTGEEVRGRVPMMGSEVISCYVFM